MAAAIFYFRFVHDLIWVRIVASSLILSLIYSLIALSLLKDIPQAQRLTYWLTGGIFGVYSLFMLTRGLVVALAPPAQDLFAPSVIQTLTFLLPLFLSIAGLFVSSFSTANAWSWSCARR
jgi:hypothetical protein